MSRLALVLGLFIALGGVAPAAAETPATHSLKCAQGKKGRACRRAAKLASALTPDRIRSSRRRPVEAPVIRQAQIAIPEQFQADPWFSYWYVAAFRRGCMPELLTAGLIRDGSEEHPFLPALPAEPKIARPSDDMAQSIPDTAGWAEGQTYCRSRAQAKPAPASASPLPRG